ncbi:hypothetical protein LCGC14_0750710 [marine sediment metagenome]|uniref:Uncharacterized protein n=1 Tax=marine sediment metagenome TaxID=412755 RepID=A0A0F9Q8A2_9ZZZZ
MSSENDEDEVLSEGRDPEPKASSDEKEEEQWDPNPTEDEKEEEQWDPNPTEDEKEEEQWDPNPTEDEKEEEQWDPTEEVQDEKQWNPNEEIEEEEQWNPTEEVQDEKQWNPNEEIEEEEPYNPMEDNPDEIYNFSHLGTETVLIEKEQKCHIEQEPEIESEKEPESKPEEELYEPVFENGKPKPPADPLIVSEIYRDLEEMGIPINPDPYYGPQDESEPEFELDQEAELPENNLEDKSEEPWNFLTPEGERLPPVETPNQEPDLITEQKPEVTPNQEPDLITEQKPEVTPEEEPDLITEQKPEVTPEEEPDLITEQNSEVILEQEPDLTTEQKPEITLERKQKIIVNSDQQTREKAQDKDFVPKMKQELNERYHQESGRRPIYAGKETKGFIEWKEKNKFLNEKEKETTEPAKEIQEFKEEWAQYLVINIEESDISDNVKEKLSNFLEIYEILKKLIEKTKVNEISEEEFKQEVKEFEHILIEESHIIKPLFMNFDWFRRYYNEIIRKSGKRVAHLIIPKKTREFLSHISGKIEQLENIGNSHEIAEIIEKFLEISFQIKEKWALLLNSIIHKVPNKEISKEVKRELEVVIKLYCEIRVIQFSKKILKEDKEKLIQKRIEKYNMRFFELFEILRRFLGIYGYYSRNWMEKSLILVGKKTVKRLSQRLENIKKKNAIHQILNEKISSVQNFKENLKLNLYNNTILDLKKKSTIIKIIRNETLSEEDKTTLISVLSKLPTKDLIFLLGDDFKKHKENNVRWDYDYGRFKEFLYYIQSVFLNL